MSEACRLITFDLPGHGQSEDAADPFRTYTRPDLADVVGELLDGLGIGEAVVLGWSLGGHIAIELLDRLPSIKGLLITDTPPFGRGEMAEAFNPSPHVAMAARKELAATEAAAFAQAIFGEPVAPFLRQAIARTDGRCHERLFAAARAGEGADQRVLVENSAVPIAVINGAADPLINLDYIDRVAFANLWQGRCHRLDGGHAVFWHAAVEFNALAARFVEDVTAGSARLRSPSPHGAR